MTSWVDWFEGAGVGDGERVMTAIDSVTFHLGRDVRGLKLLMLKLLKLRRLCTTWDVWMKDGRKRRRMRYNTHRAHPSVSRGGQLHYVFGKRLRGKLRVEGVSKTCRASWSSAASVTRPIPNKLYETRLDPASRSYPIAYVGSTNVLMREMNSLQLPWQASMTSNNFYNFHTKLLCNAHHKSHTIESWKECAQCLFRIVSAFHCFLFLATASSFWTDWCANT
jgi:hypothetical protein